MKLNKVLYISKEYLKDKELENLVYIRDDTDNEILGKIWRNYDFDKAEEKIFEFQCSLSKAAFKKDYDKVRKIQDLITHSTEARMLSVRKVSEISKASAGIDGIVWRRDSDKMKAVVLLNNGGYRASPLKQFVFTDSKANKERIVGIPTVRDRAMQVLYSYALEPVAEVMADRKSFAFRKGRSPEQVHAFIMDCLTTNNAPEWVLITDIQAYYDTLSHNWLLENIPMDKYILRQFLKAGLVFNGQLFEKDEGISLGCSLSTILANMALDGLQKRLYDLQGEEITDFFNGNCIRFADDIFITAKTRQDAETFKNEVEKFSSERGLKISDKKTKIVNIKDGFEFLARFYCKLDGVIRCIPSKKAVDKFELEIEELILNEQRVWSQSKLIDSINAKITGFTTYHKVEESIDIFKHLDVIINALLLRKMKQLYPNSTNEQLIKKYWKEDSKGRNIFSLVSNKDKCIRNMEDTILINIKKINTSKNVFLDRDYFNELEEQKDIQSCSGKYKKIWERQEAKCYICSKTIMLGQDKCIILKNSSSDKTIRNMAYVHTYCKESVVEYVNTGEENIKTLNLKEILSDLDSKKHLRNKKVSKFTNLSVYFHNLKKNSVTLTFNNIEKILKFKLCNSAYKYRTYFLNNNPGMIGETWHSQGYKVKKINMKEQKIEFIKVNYKRTKISIPKFMYRIDLPPEMVEEARKFFLHLKEKYRIK